MTRDTVPPVWQCERDDCRGEAIDPVRGSPLCEAHYAEARKTVTSPEERARLDLPSELDNETETQEGVGADTPRDPLDYDSSDDKNCNRGSCGALQEARAVTGLEEPDGVDVVDLDLVSVDEDELTAADFMGGSDSPVASDNQPERDPSSSSEASYARTVSALPLRQLDNLTPDGRRRAARKRGLEWPSTDEARDRLFDTIATTMRHEDDQVIDAPTSLGKSHTVAATRWGAREDLTGGKPVVHLSATRKARDEAAATAREHGGEHMVLLSRHEACPVAAGDHDPDQEDDENGRQILTIDGQPASGWIDDMCDTDSGKGLPFSAVHRHLEAHNDQGVDLPCTAEGECKAIQQYSRWRDGDHPLVIATHNFAHIPGLRNSTNVVVDEEPDYDVELSTERVQHAVRAYLREIDAPVTTWEAFVQLSRHDGYGTDAANERDALESALDATPDREWYFTDPDAHTLAPALARAIFHADGRANGRQMGKTPYEPPRLDAEARDDDGWNREWVSVVLTDDNEIRSVRTVPDLSAARSVTGLDAHPALPVWQANTVPWIQAEAVLDREERQLWRRYERGLRVAQVGDATRPLTSGEYFDTQGTEAVLEHLREEYGDAFRTAITADRVEDRLENLMKHVGIDEPELMHYGNVKSRNDFDGERVGFVNGCIDPGDDPILDLLAELDLDAEPERSDGECDDCGGEGCHECDGTGHKRAHGRGFTGPDADSAAAVLAAVRENQVAQAAGRYARSPDDPDDTATVFVRTDATPPGFADVQVPGAEWVYTSKQQQVVEALRDRRRPTSARDLASGTGVSKRHVHRVLERLLEHGAVDALERTGENGATLYTDAGTPNTGVVDLTDESGEVVTGPVWGAYTWSVTIADPDALSEASQDGPADTPTPSDGIWQWTDPPDGAKSGGDGSPDAAE